MLGLVLLACGGQALDVGTNRHGSGGTDAVEMADPGAGGVNGSIGGKAREPYWPDPAGCTSSEDTSIAAGTWNGYIQGQGDDFNFTLELHGPAEQPCGTLTFGEPQALVPATDPRSEYRPSGGTGDHQVFRTPGFTYTVLSARLDGTHLRFRISFAEPYASWCELQTPYHREYENFECAPNIALMCTTAGCVGSYEGQELGFSIYQFELCDSGAACFCEADGCIAKPDAEGSSFDLVLDGDQASGVINDRSNASSPTLLSRQ